MHVTAKADYAVRAVIELAGQQPGAPRKVDDVAQAQGIPVSFLENILTQLRSSGVVRSQRGPEGGYWLAQPADGGQPRADDPRRRGPAGRRPRPASRGDRVLGSAESLQQVWIALRANLRKVLEQVTRRRRRRGKLPKEIVALTRDEEAWHDRAEPGGVRLQAYPNAADEAYNTLRRWRHCSGRAEQSLWRARAKTRGWAGGREDLALVQLQLVACSRVTWAHSSRPSLSFSSTRTSKPRWTTRSTSASVPLPSDSARIWMSWGRTKASPRRLTGPMKDITNSLPGLS